MKEEDSLSRESEYWKVCYEFLYDFTNFIILILAKSDGRMLK